MPWRSRTTHTLSRLRATLSGSVIAFRPVSITEVRTQYSTGTKEAEQAVAAAEGRNARRGNFANSEKLPCPHQKSVNCSR